MDNKKRILNGSKNLCVKALMSRRATERRLAAEFLRRYPHGYFSVGDILSGKEFICGFLPPTVKDWRKAKKLTVNNCIAALYEIL